jgi:hypothetical protein
MSLGKRVIKSRCHWKDWKCSLCGCFLWSSLSGPVGRETGGGDVAGWGTTPDPLLTRGDMPSRDLALAENSHEPLCMYNHTSKDVGCWFVTNAPENNTMQVEFPLKRLYRGKW